MSAVALPSVVFREARESDLDGIADLERRAFPVPWKRDYFAVEVGAPYRFNRVARDARGELVGYVFCAHAAGEIHVNKIAVDPKWRRRGVATLLMEEVLELARVIDAVDVYLEVRLSNTAAQVFYRGMGFSQAGRRARYYLDGEDALVMVLNLDAPSRRRETPAGTTSRRRR